MRRQSYFLFEKYMLAQIITTRFPRQGQRSVEFLVVCSSDPDERVH